MPFGRECSLFTLDFIDEMLLFIDEMLLFIDEMLNFATLGRCESLVCEASLFVRNFGGFEYVIFSFN